MRVKILEADLQPFETTPDAFTIWAKDEIGRYWYHGGPVGEFAPIGFTEAQARTLVLRVRETGEIDPLYWMAPRTWNDIEVDWAGMVEREYMERNG